MNEQKLCLLLAAGDPDHTPVSAQCRGDRCAWWTGNTCAVLSQAVSLDSLDRYGITTNGG